MRICILYRPDSDYARSVEEFAHDFEARHNHKAELLSLDTREGAALASLYDIMQYPAILVLRDDGQLIQQWTGPQLPLMSEVFSYAVR